MGGDDDVPTGPRQVGFEIGCDSAFVKLDSQKSIAH